MTTTRDNLVFKIDDAPITIGNDIRVEYTDPENGRTLIIVITHEGVITDVWDRGCDEPTSTQSATFDEIIEETL